MSSQSESISAEARTTASAQDQLERGWSGITKALDDEDSTNISDRDKAQITSLARRLTDASIKTAAQGVLSNPFKDSNDPGLDPFSKEFNPRKWAETVLGLNAQNSGRYLPRKAGFSFLDLSVHGFGSPISYQKNFLNVFLQFKDLVSGLINRRDQKIQILQNHNGLLRSGEMLLVLGRPGSGVSTFLKTIAGQTKGLHLDQSSNFNYQGIPPKKIRGEFRGDVIYQAETDTHFPHLTVGQTLLYAALAKTPENRLPGVSRDEYARHIRDVTMAVFGLTHTMDTKVGNEFVRGVSGGERKRVSIAEVCLAQSPIQCWDNSTRGLDSATALKFVQTLRLSVDITSVATVVALYQASQQAYEAFDKVAVLYEGRQIYYGPVELAKDYFVDLGYHCPDRQTTPDFLTSLTNPVERVVRSGFDTKVPRSPEEFAKEWKASALHKELMQDIAEFESKYPVGRSAIDSFKESRQAEKASWMTSNSPYTVSVPLQVLLCVHRGFSRIQGDLTFFVITVGGNFVISLLLGSVFYKLQDTSASFNDRCIVLFFALLFNALNSSLEILSLYAQRPIVEKHATYAFYHPLSEAMASMICDLPSKTLSTVAFNIPLYYMANLRNEPGHVLIYLLFAFSSTLVMSMIFRTIGQTTRTIAEALTPAALMVIAMVLYTGFILPIRNMQGWLRWINYLNPLAYSYEALIANEFHGRNFECASFVPAGPVYQNVSSAKRTCSVVGASAGSSVVSGDRYIAMSYGYYYSHVWRNFGILIAFLIFFLTIYLLSAEYISSDVGKGEVLIFQRSHLSVVKEKTVMDEESGSPTSSEKSRQDEVNEPAASGITAQKNVFHWRDLCYDITIKGRTRRITDHVNGWVKPGKLTALMGASGAGKTTLLDVLANRVTMGVVTGGVFNNGLPRDASFQRRIGYVQQQDLHLETATVREALEFSAFLRQPAHVSRADKLQSVEEILDLLEMKSYADAVVGVPGEGLNVEQRKRLTIGVELAAKPDLLFFLDEPTSGLDSQTAWSILLLLRKLTDHGQAILCTIHQPSAMLFQQFDRLLLLAAGGRTVYFGDIGANSKTMTEYFERHGADHCEESDNPAEWMLRVIGAAPGSTTKIDWPATWLSSQEYANVNEELISLEQKPNSETISHAEPSLQFASPFHVQLWVCTMRIFEQYWRTPSYLFSKLIMCFVTALFIGLSFLQTKITELGLQHQMFAIFMLLVIFPFLAYQQMPNYILQRDLYEVRERPSKAYSWMAFIMAQIIVEIPWNSLAALITFLPFYYLIGMNHNAAPTHQTTERGGLMFLLIWGFLMHCGTFTTMVVASASTAEIGAILALLLFVFSLIFCGVMATPASLPGFWIFMYRTSPLTYIISGMMSTGLANIDVQCSDIETILVQPPSGETCGSYLAAYSKMTGGAVYNPDATSDCQFCAITSSNVFLQSVVSSYDERWRNFGLIWAYVAFNVIATLILYWYVRVRGSPGLSHVGVWAQKIPKYLARKETQ
ncbi:CDR ABC transporter [Penicillium waksmanii]|uniref:CDR ABC transporter n=1 Tax=Penicillium waksmanii TaxID=69791 RepID=UPI0025482F01|nr:CDR ABC transporter [Penicillium waksmanii]KAJ5982947.1 CDR ABC transporter [Penicillium waksmanii]